MPSTRFRAFLEAAFDSRETHDAVSRFSGRSEGQLVCQSRCGLVSLPGVRIFASMKRFVCKLGVKGYALRMIAKSEAEKGLAECSNAIPLKPITQLGWNILLPNATQRAGVMF